MWLMMAIGSGAPPLARSRLSPGHRAGHRRRGTSAHVEPTFARRRQPSTAQGYLRSRGADQNFFSSPGCQDGIPPLARSRRERLAERERGQRDTSARAEPTPTRRARSATTTGYLRSRGADPQGRRGRSGSYGIPPLARSRPRRSRTPRPRTRDTSACALPTATTASPCPTGPGHLRSRGADDALVQLGEQNDGSPLLARSRRRCSGSPASSRRVTSARAEPTTACSFSTGSTTGHLRLLGDDPRMLGACRPRSGSPPLARSRRRRRRQRPRWFRDTFARAEPTSSSTTQTSPTGGHLRSRGARSTAVHAMTDLPPLARSRLVDLDDGDDRVRDTSARAEPTRPRRLTTP